MNPVLRFGQKPFMFVVALLSLCVWISISPAADKKITYEEHVLPILRDKCVGCHSQDKMRGGLAVHSYTSLMAGGSSGEVIKPGDPDGSRLFLLVSHKQEPHMPPKSPRIPSENIETIRQWIAGGALENTGSKAKVVNKPKFDLALSAAVKGKPEGPPPMPPASLSLDPVVRTARPNAVTAIASSPWAPLVALAGQKQVFLYHSDTLDLLGVLPFPEGVPHVLKFSRNGSLLLAGGGRGAKSGKVIVWNVRTGERLFELGEETDAVLAADISSDQTQIALGGPGKLIRVYSTKDGQLLREIKKHTDWIYTLEYSPDGVLLASGDRSGGLFVWEAFTGREYLALRAHTSGITEVSWRADSNVLASASEDTTIRLWEMENGGNIKGWGAHPGGVASVHFARDGRIVSCGRDRHVRLWDGNGGGLRALEPFPDLALKVTFSHDGGRVIAGDWSGQVRVWSAADGKLLGHLDLNPLPYAQRLEQLAKEVSSRQQVQSSLVAAAKASQEAAQKAAQALQAAQKLAKETAEKAAADRARADQNAAALDAARVKLERLKAVRNSVRK